MRSDFLNSILAFGCAVALSGCAGSIESVNETADLNSESTARFDWLKYEGADPVHSSPIEAWTQYRNPVLSGFYPDPSITQAGDKYYLVNSTFSYFPGIPVFESTDLVSWKQIGNVIDRPSMLNFDGLGLSRGVFAPTIEYHDGTFYVANTCVDCGGNFVVTAEDPAGPWSDPIWLPEVGGIDPSLYFDHDGTVYLMNNDAPVGEPRYQGHRAIWIRAVDPETFESISEPKVLIDGGVRPEANPIWIEGPHIYFKDGYYYLSAAEGGTAVGHSQVILRSREVEGPYRPFEGNPIMTHRHLDPDRDNPITSVGHADYVIDEKGDWWATFLAVRPYEGDFYNTGRETFLMPVRWEDGWPIIIQGEEKVGYVQSRPALPVTDAPAIPISGNFIIMDDFETAELPFYWMMPRVPKLNWHSVDDGQLHIMDIGTGLGEGEQPTMLGRRQQHLNATATTKIDQLPVAAGTETGLAAFQSDDYFYALGVTKNATGDHMMQLRRKAGGDDPINGEVVASNALPKDMSLPLYLRIEAKGGAYDFAYSTDNQSWTDLRTDLDGKILSTRTAGGFVGAVFGLYVQDPK
ncbi:glycoside hydrolase family 43 protein [Litorimonas cladophorae]|uniref:glycoside hydrolase family 43 protein n=1 Tax=Litorimonas cladophorae TaxID=1220491 RepID=UPI00167B5048|nr:glycoside hydrolase family 43 protein [Litorimonas cladophorae]